PAQLDYVGEGVDLVRVDADDTAPAKTLLRVPGQQPNGFLKQIGARSGAEPRLQEVEQPQLLVRQVQLETGPAHLVPLSRKLCGFLSPTPSARSDGRPARTGAGRRRRARRRGVAACCPSTRSNTRPARRRPCRSR